MLESFEKGFSENCGVRLIPGKLHSLCELGWPTFGVGWPLEGTPDLPTVRAGDRAVTGTSGNPDTWLQIATGAPLGLVWRE